MPSEDLAGACHRNNPSLCYPEVITCSLFCACMFGYMLGSSVYVQGLSEYRVLSSDDVLALMAKGLRNRAIRSTELNNESSRSHTILQLYVQLQDVDDGGLATLKRSVFSFVDLAGSEKWRPPISSGQVTSSGLVTAQQTAAEQQLREMTNINTSLHVLGNCVSALIEPGRRHIPFRDSLLTRLLQDSLGGGRTILIATVRSDEGMIDETYSTLQFASRASKIKTVLRPSSKILVGNEGGSDGLTIDKARKEVALLRSQLQSLQLELTAARAQPSITVHKELEGEEHGTCENCVILREALVQCQHHIRELQELVADDIERKDRLDDDAVDEVEDGRQPVGDDDRSPYHSFSTDDEQNEGGVDVELADIVRQSSPIVHPNGRSSLRKRSILNKDISTNADYGASKLGSRPLVGSVSDGKTRAPLSKEKMPKRKHRRQGQHSHQPSPQHVGGTIRKRIVGEGVTGKGKRKGNRVLSAGDAPYKTSEKSKLPSLKSNSAGSIPTKNQSRAVLSEIKKEQLQKVECGAVDRLNHPTNIISDHVGDMNSACRVMDVAAISMPITRDVLSTPILSSREHLPCLPSESKSRAEQQSYNYRRVRPDDMTVPVNSFKSPFNRQVCHDNSPTTLTQHGAHGQPHTRDSQLMSSPHGEQLLTPQAASATQSRLAGNGPLSPDSVHSVLTAATEAPRGACRKHGLQACVLCAMFGVPSSSSQVALANTSSYTAVQNSSHLTISAPAITSSQTALNSGLAHSSGLCQVHRVLDCLLCSMKHSAPVSAISMGSAQKKEQKDGNGRTMYTASMLGDCSLASSMSSLSSADSAYGFNYVNAMHQHAGPPNIKNRPPDSRSEYRTQATKHSEFSFGGNDTGSHQEAAAEVAAYPSALKQQHDSESLTPSYTSKFSSMGKMSVKSGGGVTYEDEADMVADGEQQSLQTVMSNGRRDHRRVPFNREKYGEGNKGRNV